MAATEPIFRFFCVSGLLLVHALACGQTDPLLRPTPLDSVHRIEKGLGSTDNGTTYFDPYGDDDIADMVDLWPHVEKKPRIYQRPNDGFIRDPMVWYFSDKSGVVWMVRYGWSLAEPVVDDDPQALDQVRDGRSQFEMKYRSSRDHITARIGPPNTETTSHNASGALRMKAIWDKQDVRVILTMIHEQTSITIPASGERPGFSLPLSKVEVKVIMKDPN